MEKNNTQAHPPSATGLNMTPNFVCNFVEKLFVTVVVKISGLDDYDFDPFKNSSMEIFRPNPRFFDRFQNKAKVRHPERCVS